MRVSASEMRSEKEWPASEIIAAERLHEIVVLKNNLENTEKQRKRLQGICGRLQDKINSCVIEMPQGSWSMVAVEKRHAQLRSLIATLQPFAANVGACKLSIEKKKVGDRLPALQAYAGERGKEVGSFFEITEPREGKTAGELLRALLLPLGIAVYIWAIARYPHFQTWIATSSLILSHLQVVGLLGSLTTFRSSMSRGLLDTLRPLLAVGADIGAAVVTV